MANEFTFAEDNAERPVTMFGPDFPFPFDDWIAHPAGIGSIPQERHGEEVAIVGLVCPAWWRLTNS
jgi:tryptophan 2-monooxygenase